MSPTPRTWLEYFAKELIAWREFRGTTQDQLAKAITFSSSLVAMVETCQRKPKPDFIQRCDDALQTGGALMRLYKELVSREVVPDYLNQWGSILQGATAISSFQPLVLHGLLQTPDYATAIFKGGPPPLADIDAQVQARLAMQDILTRNNPPMFVCVLDEGVIHRLIGSPEIMREQLLHLVKLAEQPHIVLHVVPNGVGAYPGLAGAFTIASLDGDDLVYLDNALTGQVTDGTADVARTKRMWESLRAEALPRSASLQLIMEAADRWTT